MHDSLSEVGLGLALSQDIMAASQNITKKNKYLCTATSCQKDHSKTSLISQVVQKNTYHYIPMSFSIHTYCIYLLDTNRTHGQEISLYSIFGPKDCYRTHFSSYKIARKTCDTTFWSLRIMEWMTKRLYYKNVWLIWWKRV